jgi:hypothetical protein
MNKQAAIRRVRIGVSVLLGVLIVALCVLWVRSRWSEDTMFLTHPLSSFVIKSQASGLWIIRFKNDDYQPVAFWRSDPSDFPFNWEIVKPDAGGWIPYWLTIFLAAAVASLPFIPWSRRFSLRTILIATTLVAVVGAGSLAEVIENQFA